MISMIFARNDFGMDQELLDAINAACALDPNSDWRARKVAFNTICEKAPMNDESGIFCVKYADIPQVIETWCTAYVQAVNAAIVDRNDPNQFDLHMWDQVQMNWFVKKVGETEVHLKAGPESGWEITVREGGNDDRAPLFVPVFGDALEDVNKVLLELEADHAEVPA